MVQLVCGFLPCTMQICIKIDVPPCNSSWKELYFCISIDLIPAVPYWYFAKVTSSPFSPSLEHTKSTHFVPKELQARRPVLITSSETPRHPASE